MHLNGSLPAKTIIFLAKKYNIKLPTFNEKSLTQLISVPLDCDNLNDYLKCTKIPRMVTQSKESIKEAISLLLNDLHNQGLIYAEIRFAPQRHQDNGLSQEDVIKAAISGLQNSPIMAKLILCCMRGKDVKSANMETIRLAHKYLNKGVGGVDLAGAEALFPTQDYAEEFNYASSLGVPFTIHAGEADGPNSIIAALNLGAKRIGHGIRAALNEDLMQRLVKEKITLEMCPSSNFQTKSVLNKQEYPLRLFLDKGIKVTINTDNKTISGTNLSGEYNFAINELGLKEEERVQLYENAIEASFTTLEEKAILLNRLHQSLNI